MNRIKCVAGLLALAALVAVALAEDKKDKDKKKEDAKEVVIEIKGEGGASQYIEKGKDKQAAVTVLVGQKVTWKNLSEDPHTATSDKKKEKEPVWTTKKLAGMTKEKTDSDSVTFDDAMFKALGGKDGENLEVPYHCKVHPKTMMSKLILKPAAKDDKDKKEEKKEK